MKKRNIVLLIFMAVTLCLMLGTAVYAWFESNFDPVVYSNEMKISATDGLVIQLTDSPSATTINVRDVIRDFESQFGLSQVSTIDNTNFFKRIPNDTTFEYVLAEKNKDYIEVSFMISAETTIYGSSTPAPTRKIYIKSLTMDVIGKDSEGHDIVISDTNFANDALRTSLIFEYTDVENDTTEKHEYLLAKNSVVTVIGDNVAVRADNYIDKTTGIAYDNTVVKAMNNETDGFVGYRLFNAIKEAGIESSSSYGEQDVHFAGNYIYEKKMKLICIKQYYPEDDWGAGPNDYAAIINKKHNYYASVCNWWESPGAEVSSNDAEVKDDEMYNYCFDKILEFIDNNESNCDEYEDEFGLSMCVVEISEEEFDKNQFVKESVCMNFADNFDTKCFSFNNDELSHFRYCLEYLMHDLHIDFLLSEEDDSENFDTEELVEKINNTK